MKYYMGIDSGGTSTKVAIFTESGQQVGGGSVQTPTETPADGFQERDLELLWRQTAQLVKQVIADAGVNAEDIRGVSFSGYGKGLCLVNGQGKPVGRGILSTDSRAENYASRWREGNFLPLFQSLAKQNLTACQPLCLLKWLQCEQPERLKQAKYIFGVKDYIRFCLTGKAYFERTDFSGSGLCVLGEERVCQELLDAAGLSSCKDLIPPVVRSDGLAGHVTAEAAALTGLQEGTPCAGGVFDIDACALAMGVVDESAIAVIAGTWGINEYLAPQPTGWQRYKNSLYALPGYYIIEESAATSAGNLDWFLNNLLEHRWQANREQGETLVSYAIRLAQSVLPEECRPLYLPFLYGGDIQPNARACFLGIDAAVTIEELCRSVLEGVVFCHRAQIERLKENHCTAKTIRLCGGVCNAPFWVQMFADVLQMPVEAAEGSYTGALGAAQTAMVACGDAVDLRAAVSRMVQPRHTVLPRRDVAELYEKKYRRYKAAAAALEPVWREG